MELSGGGGGGGGGGRGGGGRCWKKKVEKKKELQHCAVHEFFLGVQPGVRVGMRGIRLSSSRRRRQQHAAHHTGMVFFVIVLVASEKKRPMIPRKFWEKRSRGDFFEKYFLVAAKNQSKIHTIISP